MHNLNSFALIGPFKMPTNCAYLAKEVIIIIKTLAIFQKRPFKLTFFCVCDL